MAPHTSGLPSAEGGFETPLGWFGVRWTLTTAGSSKLFTLELQTPTETSGSVRLPFGGQTALNGKVADMPKDGLFQLSGGGHRISVRS